MYDWLGQYGSVSVLMCSKDNLNIYLYIIHVYTDPHITYHMLDMDSYNILEIVEMHAFFCWGFSENLATQPQHILYFRFEIFL